MEVYQRVTEKVRGALWAHHRRLMPERQFQRILGYVYSNKYEHQIRLDKMQCVGTELGGKVEVVTTPAGHIKHVRVNPDFQDLPKTTQRKVLVSAYSKAAREGREIMEATEMRIYKQFLQDIKPIVMGIRDNPEFYTVPEDSLELPGATMKRNALRNQRVYRTIPYNKAYQPSHEFKKRKAYETDWLASEKGMTWAKSAHGQRYVKKYLPEKQRRRGQPGAKRAVGPLEVLAPYTPMDEGPLLKRNWQAFLNNKHVAETLWTRARMGDREKKKRLMQQAGRAWHTPLNQEAETRF